MKDSLRFICAGRNIVPLPDQAYIVVLAIFSPQSGDCLAT